MAIKKFHELFEESFSNVDAFADALWKEAGWYCMDNKEDKEKFIKWLEENCNKFDLPMEQAIEMIQKNDSWCTDNDEDMGWFIKQAFGLETKAYKEAEAEGYYKENGFKD